MSKPKEYPQKVRFEGTIDGVVNPVFEYFPNEGMSGKYVYVAQPSGCWAIFEHWQIEAMPDKFTPVDEPEAKKSNAEQFMYDLSIPNELIKDCAYGSNMSIMHMLKQFEKFIIPEKPQTVLDVIDGMKSSLEHPRDSREFSRLFQDSTKMWLKSLEAAIMPEQITDPYKKVFGIDLDEPKPSPQLQEVIESLGAQLTLISSPLPTREFMTIKNAINMLKRVQLPEKVQEEGLKEIIKKLKKDVAAYNSVYADFESAKIAKWGEGILNLLMNANLAEFTEEDMEKYGISCYKDAKEMMLRQSCKTWKEAQND